MTPLIGEDSIGWLENNYGLLLAGAQAENSPFIGFNKDSGRFVVGTWDDPNSLSIAHIATEIHRNVFGPTQLFLNGLEIGGGPNRVTVNASPVTPYSITLPVAQGAAGTVISNDGAGNLSWVVAAKGLVGLGNVENTALSTWAGTTNLTTLGAATATSLTSNGIFGVLGRSDLQFGNADLATGLRWVIKTNTVAETGSNAGSNLEIIRRSDTGTNLGTTVTVNRSSGDVLLATTLHVTGNTTFSARLIQTGAAGSSKDYSIQTSGINRWTIGADATAESGSDAGTNYYIASRHDDGSANLNVLSILRSTGAATFISSLSCQALSSTTISSQTITPTTTDTYDLGSSSKWWRQQFVSQINATVFARQTQSLMGGWLTVGKDEGVMPAVAATDTQIDFGKAMTVGDFIVIKGASSTGALVVEYMQIGTLVSGTLYNVTRDKAGTYGTKPAYSNGTPYLVLGANGSGRIEMNAYDTPRISIFKQGATYDGQTEVLRIGDLNGLAGIVVEDYGVYIGSVGNSLVYDSNAGTLTLSGALNAATGSFSGTVTATAGAIGGLTLSSSTLVAGSAGTHSAGQGYLSLNSSATQPVFVVGWSDGSFGANAGNNFITIGATSYLYAVSGQFDVTGWDTSGGGIAVNVNGAGIFFAGARNTSKGIVYGGTIAGWNFDNACIWTGTKQTADTYSATGITIAASGAIYASQFYVGVGGDAHFRGAVESATITGGTIRTASSGTRIELNSGANSIDIYALNTMVATIYGQKQGTDYWLLMDFSHAQAITITNNAPLNLSGGIAVGTSAAIGTSLSVGTTITSYNGVSTAGLGTAPIIYNNYTTSAASISSTNITNTNVAGVYRVSVILTYHATVGTAGTVTCTVNWTDDGGTILETSSALTVSGINVVEKTFFIRHKATSSAYIHWLTTIGGSNTNQYNIQVTCERLV